MDGDTGTVHGIHNVTYTLESERRTLRAIRFNRNKSKDREKRRSHMNGDYENTDYITTIDWLPDSPDIDRKANVTSKQYTKCLLCKRQLRKTSVDFKPLKRILSSCSFVGKSKIQGISISPGNVTLINNIESSDENVRNRGDNEVKVLYKRDFRRIEKNKQIISPRRSATRDVETKNSQTSLFGFQRCIQRKRHINYNLSVFYKLLQGDAKHHNVLRCKHYSFEDLNLNKPKKKSSFVKSKNDAPAHYNLVNFTQHSSISNVYLLKPKYYKKMQSLRKNKSPFRFSDFDKKSILKKDEDCNNTDVLPLETKNKEQKADTKDDLTSRPLYKGVTGVSICKPSARIRNSCSQVKPKITTSRKSSKKSVELFNFLHAAMKYLLFVMTLIIWFPCFLVLALGWLISYPCRPHKDFGGSKGARTKRRRKLKEKKKNRDKPPQVTKHEKECSIFENKKEQKESLKKKPIQSNSKKKKGVDKKCSETCLDCTQYTVTPTGFYVPESTTAVAMFPNDKIVTRLGKKSQKCVSFKQPGGRTSETYIKISKYQVCSGCRDKNAQSIDVCGDMNQTEEDSEQKSDSNNQCQAIVIKSCKGKVNQRKIEVCVPKSLSRLLQSALSTCSATNQLANVRKLPKIRSCNSTAATCIALKKKRKCLSRQSKYIMRNLKKNIDVSRSSATRCLPSPCPDSCATKAPPKLAPGGGDSKKRKKSKQLRKKRKIRKPNTVVPPLKTYSICSDISLLQPTPESKPIKRVRRCNRNPPVRRDVRTVSSNTVMLQTSSFFQKLKQKYVKKREKPTTVKTTIPILSPKRRHISSNTSSTQKPKKPRKTTTVVKFFPLPQHRLIHSSINTRKTKLASGKKVKSKSNSACLTSSNKIITFFPKPRSSTIACSTCELKLPLEPLEKQPKKKKLPSPKADCNSVCLVLEGRKSYDKRHSQEMLPKKPDRVCTFFPASRHSTRTLAVEACIKDEVKLPSKSNKSTTFPQKTFFGSLSATTGTNTCSGAPTKNIKFIKTHKSRIIDRGTAQKKLVCRCSKPNENVKKKEEKPKKPVKICTTPGTISGTTQGKKPGTTPGKKPSAVLGQPCTKACMTQSHESENLKKRSTGITTKPVQTRSKKVMHQATYPIIRFLPRPQVMTCTRGVNTRNPESCFAAGYRRFQEKRKIRKLRKAADEKRKILICKKSSKSCKASSPSSPRSTTGNPTPCSSQSALQAKQRAERAKKLAKEKAKGRSKDRAKVLAKQKAKRCAKALKGRGKKTKVKSKTRKRKGKKAIRKNAGKAFKKLTPSAYNVKCEDMMARPNRPGKIINDICPSAYPIFMVFHKMYKSVFHIIFFVLACCIWTPLFCCCFVLYITVIKRLICYYKVLLK